MDDTASSIDSCHELHQCCGRCYDLLDALERHPSYDAVPNYHRTQTIRFHNVVELQASAIEGCHLCSLIETEISDDHMEKLHQHFDESLSVFEKLEAHIWINETGGPRLGLSMPWREPMVLNKEPIVDLEYELVASDIHARRIFTVIAPTTASWETCNDIQSWLRTCEIEHDKCIDRRQRQEWRFPTRLLYVGILEGGNILRLCESRLLSAHPKYATLSHCWGGVVIGKLTSAVYSSYKNGFSIAGLPRNFRDAITLTRSLGIEYLWIDSLCIIQDSATDWETECELMSDVYGGSFVNIAASASSNANGGIFDNRDLRRVTPFKTQLAFKSNSQLKGTFAFLPRTCDFGDLEQTPLSKRAWTVQERLLAPRTLHFLSHKVVWECSSLQASESDVTGKLDRRSKSGLQDWALPSSGNCLSKWDTAVQMYTRGELTLPSDKLIAISGVAKFIKNMWQNNSVRYLAGLWSYQIESSLAWRTFKGTPLVNDEYRAPTWSWASVDGPVSPNVLWEESNVLPTRVLHAYTEPISDPFGAVKGGFIKVSGPLCHVQSRSSDEEPCSEEFPLLLASTGHRLRFRELHFDNRGPRDNHTVSEQKYALAGLSKLFTTATPMEGVLLQTTGRKPGQYIRIGYFLIENWGRPIEDKEDTFECLQCHHEQDADLSDSYPRNDYERIEEAFEEMDLPPSMYEQKDEATSAYIYEII